MQAPELPNLDLAVPQQAACTSLLDIDSDRFRAAFDRSPFLIGHRLAEHPLLALPRLVELARQLPERCIEYNAGNVPVHLDPGQTPRTGLSAAETVRRIEECNSWLVLKNIEQQPEYRELLRRCLAEVAVHSEPLFPGMMKPEGFVFVSSPGAVTPYHVDPEHNFLLQIRGRKQVHVFDGRDRGLLSEEELERYYSGAHRNLAYREELEARAQPFELHPGSGLHIPVTYPHWVCNGPEVSISFSITFYTPDLDRRRGVHQVNGWLRRHGWTSAPFAQSPWRDSLKFLGYRLWRRGRQFLGKAAG